MLKKQDEHFFSEIRHILIQARQKAYSTANFIMVEAYWQVGKLIVEQEQHGEKRADYGSYLLRQLAVELSNEFGKSFDERELRRIRQFYIVFSIRDTLRPELSWSHYRLLIRIPESDKRNYYLNEAANCAWSSRTMERQINSLFYDRLISSQNREPVLKEMQDNIKAAETRNEEIVKNPYIFEFLGLNTNSGFREKELEDALINHLQKFLLEMGKGFAFVARQQHIRTETSDFFIDLVFYNYILKCFVIIDLKTDKLAHQDVGQLDMYVRMYDDLKRTENDNPTIGILLCTETDSSIVRYSVLNESKQLFASKYLAYLPTEEDLRKLIEQNRYWWEQKKKENNENV
jgi:predicted nuclease of restriction endonuclease-like (RecB) superfamily